MLDNAVYLKSFTSIYLAIITLFQQIPEMQPCISELLLL